MGIPVRHNSKRELTAFFAAAFVVSWGLWLPALLIQSRILSIPVSCNFFLRAGSFGPSVSGLILAYAFGGKTEFRSLLRSMTDIHIRPKWLFFIFLVLPGVSGASCLIYWLTGGRLPQPQFELWFAPVAFAYILIFMGPLGEEAGWRGFALKRMLRNASPMKSAVLLGIIWSLWHLPLFFIEGTTQSALAAFGLLPAFSCYLLYTVMISVLITLLSVMSNGSVLGSMLFHTMGNLSLGVMPLVFSKSGAVILLLVLSAATAGFTYKYRKTMFYKEKYNEKTPQKASVTIEPTDNTVAQTPDLSPNKPVAAPEKTDDIKTDSGRYAGQADSNFIEIKISGVPKENAAKEFMLSEDLKNNFNDLELETGDDIKFDCYVKENEHNVIVSIEKI